MIIHLLCLQDPLLPPTAQHQHLLHASPIWLRAHMQLKTRNRPGEAEVQGQHKLTHVPDQGLGSFCVHSSGPLHFLPRSQATGRCIHSAFGFLFWNLIAAQDQLCQLHLHVQRVVGALELQHQDAVGVAEDASLAEAAPTEAIQELFRGFYHGIFQRGAWRHVADAIDVGPRRHDATANLHRLRQCLHLERTGARLLAHGRGLCRLRCLGVGGHRGQSRRHLRFMAIFERGEHGEGGVHRGLVGSWSHHIIHRKAVSLMLW
mmetsp:Transcript_43430/g.88759  ORF Transcript_43430/g.88759 Transcript_43430/m.88759 type:complete len:261 (+) Transcript_43430:744-1526(+)